MNENTNNATATVTNMIVNSLVEVSGQGAGNVVNNNDVKMVDQIMRRDLGDGQVASLMVWREEEPSVRNIYIDAFIGDWGAEVEFFEEPAYSKNFNKQTGRAGLSGLVALKEMLAEAEASVPVGYTICLRPSDERRGKAYWRTLRKEGWSRDSDVGWIFKIKCKGGRGFDCLVCENIGCRYHIRTCNPVEE